jgi:hypothetical protein
VNFGSLKKRKTENSLDIFLDVLVFLKKLYTEVQKNNLNTHLLAPSFCMREKENSWVIGLEWNLEKSNLIVEFSFDNIEISYLDKDGEQTAFNQANNEISNKLLDILKEISFEEILAE